MNTTNRGKIPMEKKGGDQKDSIQSQPVDDVHRPAASNSSPSDASSQWRTTTLQRSDSLAIEAGSISGAASHHAKGGSMHWGRVARLAFQSIGVVYGDIGTSPLYVYASTFTDGIQHKDDVLGVLSLIIYTIALIPLIKYVLIVLRANDNGDGGTFAMYSLICRYTKISLLPSQQAEDREVSNFQLQLPDRRTQRATALKQALEKSSFAKYFLLIATMLGTSMVIGDGVLTPCISVLSAVAGLKEATNLMTDDKIVAISAVILILLFVAQRFGTDKVGYAFAPVLVVWFICIAGIGAYNWAKYDPLVIKALNPVYIFSYFRRNGKSAWISLGGVVLCITGVEALFADVGHFSVRSIQISMCSLAFPSLILAYAGQASYLREHMEDVGDTFYKSIPGRLYWPVFIVAILAAVIASQAMISGTFSIIQQSVALGCFPRVKVVHTSPKYEGQIYIPEINYALMLACLAVTLGFGSTASIGNAYGIAVVFVMVLTSCFLVLVMILIWKVHIAFIVLYVVVIGSVELIYLSSVLYKFDQGGYLPLSFAVILIMVMLVWNYVYCKRYAFELAHKVPRERLEEIASDSNMRQIPGVAFFYSELVQGIPPIFEHYVVNVPALHSVVVFVSMKSLPISKVPPEERFLFRRVVSQPDRLVFRCIVRYGYKDTRNENEPFDMILLGSLKQFLEEDAVLNAKPDKDDAADRGEGGKEGGVEKNGEGGASHGSSAMREMIEREVMMIERLSRDGVVHLLGENEVVASKGSSLWKRVVIDYAYNILKRNLRQQDEVFLIPRKKLLKVGMTIEL